MKRTKNPAKEAEYRKRAADLVAQMTLHEKVSQMLSWAPAIERLGIPAYNWWSEGIHGVGRAGTATVFPQAIGMAAAFDEDMMEQVGNAVGVEARGKYNMFRAHGDRDIFKGLTVWAPNINIFRDPRWGRGHETYGEDPFLTSRLGVRFVEGMQGNDPDYLQAAACAKHFAVHSGPESDRHHFNAIVSKQDLWETYLPAFRALVKEAGVEAVMGAYNRTNGEPCCGSKTLLKDILRDKWHFDGHVTSDCWAIKDFHTGHMVTDGPVESVALAVNNGCDLNCGDLYVYLEQAVAEGKLSEEKIDESLTRLYVTRMRLGMFDAEDQVPYNKVGYDVVDSAEMKALNLKVADSIMTLLKNDGTLPLDKSKLHTVGVIGPNGVGKSTLFKMIVGKEQPTSGTLELGETVKLSYVDQGREGINPKKNVWEVVSDGLDYMMVCETEVPSRAYVASFGFKGSDQQKPAGVLSGGERNRLNLALTLKQGGNLLLLDEPTNDLDVETLESLENALLEFPGCAVVISHDRWFLDRVATHILAWEGDDDNPAKWYWFEGNFQAYQENKVTRLGEDAARPHRLHKKLVRG